MKFARQDKAGSANGIAALAILKMLLDALLKKELLSEEEVDNLVQEAERNSETDRQRRDLIEQRNKADGLVYSTERMLEERGSDSVALRCLRCLPHCFPYAADS